MGLRSLCQLTAILIVLVSSPSVLEAQPTPAGMEFQVNTYTTYWQYDAAIAVGDDRAFVVVWESDFQDGSGYSVQGQRFDSAGAMAGGEFQVNTHTTGDQDDPEVAIDASGDFVVVWVSNDAQDGSNDSVQGQRYNSDGTAAGSEFQVNTYTTGGQDSPAVAKSPGGAFVVVWESDYGDGNLDSVHGQRYNSDGTAAGGEFQINTYTTGDQDDPEVAMDASGNFVVVWESMGQDGSGDSVQGQRYNSDGTAAGGEFQVNTSTPANQDEPRVAMDDSGNFVVVWVDSRFNDNVRGQRYNSDGTAAGGEFQVNTFFTGGQDSPDVAMSPGGAFVAVWESDSQDGSGNSVHGQRYQPDGTPVGGEFQVNTYTTNYQEDPAVGVADDGYFVVVWESYGQDSHQDSVQGQRYAGPLPVVLQTFSLD